VQQAALKRPPARNAELPASQAARGGAAGALAQTLNGSPRVVAQRALAVQLNRGGLPENLRNGVERLSGVSMAGVNVHYNSAKPAQLNAEAYAQGRNIHLAPGKAHHLPHEAWHVVQQAQGRVRPTTQLRAAVPINDEKHLEREADTMGKMAAALGGVAQRAVPNAVPLNPKPVAVTGPYAASAQGDKILYDANKQPRSQFRFTPATRFAVLSNFNPSFHPFDKNIIVAARDSHTGQQTNIAGLQLDHHISWESISQYMQNQNYNPANSHYPKYTLRDARNYYSDLTNLHPVLAAHNAAAGAHGVAIRHALPLAIGQAVANLQGNWQHFQNHLTEAADTLNPGEQADVVSELNSIADKIDAGTTTLF